MRRVKMKVRQAVADRHLGEVVLKACIQSVSARNRVVNDFENIEEIRDDARAARQKAINNIDPYLERFDSAFTGAGGTVHNAATALQACQIITGILKQRGVKHGVKSKSMVSEEIQLNCALNSAGIDVVESDLGEFIIQLADEPPSHITAPALHRSRQDIGKLFAEKLNIPYTDDPTELTGAARKILRQRFLTADFAISGANFLIADTGHLGIVENEGNIRLGLSVPRLYIAVCGIERVVENLSDMACLLKVLASNATGQRATGYVNLLHPGKTGEDGPEEIHLVLVDNGRRRALSDQKLREMMLCIRCGACLNICPVYRTTGGHAYASVYPGPMGAVLSNLIGERMLEHDELPYLSTLCGACRDICPLRIDIPRMLLDLRGRVKKQFSERLFATGWHWSMKTQPRYEIAGRVIRTVAKFLSADYSSMLPDSGKAAFREKENKP